MTLDDHLAAEAAQHDSLFRMALAREDQARLARMREIAAEAPDLDAFARQALFIGWTPGDLRSRDLEEPLRPVFAALWAEARSDRDEARLLAAWYGFNTERMRILIHCL